MTLLHDKATRTRGAATAATTTTGRRAGRTAGGERASRSALAQRAIDRRSRRIARGGDAAASRTGRVRRIPFVVPIVIVLVAGLGLSLWLSTKAAQDSYRLGVARNENQSLSDRVDTLKQTFESGDSATALSDKAGKLGMIPSDNPPRMIVEGNGTRRVVGQLSPAQGRSLPSINDTAKTEDPLDKIDKTKVDDPNGLDGNDNPSASSQTPAADTNSSGAQSNSPSTRTPETSGTTLAPNVLPTAVSNPPGGNSGQSG